MPLSNLAHRRFSITIVALMLLMLLVGSLAMIFAYQTGDAVNALRTSGARNECRTRIVNDDADRFRRQIATVLADFQAGDRAAGTALIVKMRDQKSTQAKIAEVCPAPLVAGSDKPRR